MNRVGNHSAKKPGAITLPSNRDDSRFLTGEFLIDTNLVYVPALSLQSSPAVAFDGSNYLVVWMDNRSGSSDIYGTRVSPAGTVLDRQSIPIATGFYDHWLPSVAFDGTNFLVVWADNRNGSWDIYGTRVSPAGTVLDPQGLAIATAEHDQSYPAVAFDQTNCLVVWMDNRSGSDSDIYCTRVSPAGILLDSSGIAIVNTAASQSCPVVAFDGSNYLVAWMDTRTGSYDIYASRVTPAVTILDHNGFAVSSAPQSQSYPRLAYDGTNYLTVWMDERNGSPDIYGARITRTGTVLDPGGIAITTASYDQMYPSVAFAGASYLVAWMDNRRDGWDIYAVRVSPSGTVLDPPILPVTTAEDDQGYPFIVFGQTDYLVVWTDERSSFDKDVYGARVSPAGTVLDPAAIAIATSAYGQDFSSVAFDGTNYFVVWADNRNGSLDIYGARVSPAGTVLDPSAVVITTAAADQSHPAVGFDGTNFFVVWADGRSRVRLDIYGARVSTSGTVLDPEGIAIATTANSQGLPALAFDGINFFVVWAEWRNSLFLDVYGCRVSPTGTVLDPQGITVATGADDQGFPEAAFDGTNFFVVWTDRADISGGRVSPAGTVLDSPPIIIAPGTMLQNYPAVAFDGTNYLVVWVGDFNIYGARVSASGILLDSPPIPIAAAENNQSSPAVTFDGSNYLVVWKDNRSGYFFDMYGCTLSPSGIIVNSFPVSVQPGNQFYPAAAKGHGSQVLVTYSGWVDSIFNYPANTLRIWGKFSPFTGTEETEDGRRKTEDAVIITPGLFSTYTTICFSLSAKSAERQTSSLRIYDISGRCVKTFLVNQSPESRTQSLSWNGSDDSGQRLPAGIYFCRAETAGSSITKKIVKLR